MHHLDSSAFICIVSSVAQLISASSDSLSVRSEFESCRRQFFFTFFL